MKTVGNAKARAIWEGNLPSGFQVPDENASRAVMDVWIADKYQHKKYFKPVRPCDAVPIPVPSSQAQAEPGHTMPCSMRNANANANANAMDQTDSAGAGLTS